MAFLENKYKTGIKVKNNICCTCLSEDRKLFPIGNHKELYQKFIRPFSNDNHCDGNSKSHEDVFVCWECQAVLKKIKLFQQKAVEAEHILLEFMLNQDSTITKCLSSLTKMNTTELNHECFYSDIEKDALKPEISVRIDKEDFEDYSWYKSSSITFVDTESPDNYVADMKIETLLKSEERQLMKSKWMEKRVTLNKKPKFKIIPYNENKIGRSYVKVMMTQEELIERLEAEKESFSFKSAHFKCVDCVSVFSSEKSYVTHRNVKHGKNKYECDICHSSFSSKKDLKKHCRSHYYKYQCLLCRNFSYTKTQFYNHWSCTHKRKFECVKCKLHFWSRKEFYRHYKDWHQRFVCDHCGMSFKMRYCIKTHLRKKHSPFECKMCDKRFSRYNGLWLHNKVKHPTQELEKAYCVECNKHFDNIYCYKWHLNNSVVHKPRKKVRVPCPSCDKVFSKNIYMKDHYDLVHLKNYKYRCEACDKNFSRNADLVKHRRRVHEGVQTPRNKICYVCGRGFSSNKILNNHIRTHTGERPFGCAQCPARFAQSAALAGHQKNVHLKGSGRSFERPAEQDKAVT